MNYRIRRAIERYIQVHGQQDTRDAVSYTHLDVYKRQLLYRLYPSMQKVSNTGRSQKNVSVSLKK